MKIKLSDILIDHSFNTRQTTLLLNIEDLMSSMASPVGLLQPIVVVKLDAPKDGKTYALDSGYRRATAAQRLGWEEIDCVIKEDNSENMRRLRNIIENCQRENLTFVESANAIRDMLLIMNETEVAKQIGKSRSWVQERHYFLLLPKPVQDVYSAGLMTSHELRQAYSVYTKFGEKVLYRTVRAVKTAKQEGKAAPDMGRIAAGKKYKHIRGPKPKRDLAVHIATTIGTDNPFSKLLAWTLGEISDEEIDAVIAEYEPLYKERSEESLTDVE